MDFKKETIIYLKTWTEWFSALGHDLQIWISKSIDIMIQIHNSS